MTDASKRLAPDGGFTAADLPEDVAEELLELPEDFRDGFAVVEEPLPFPEMAWLGGMTHPPAIPLDNWRRLQYDEIDERIPLPKGIDSTRAWGATEVVMPKFRGVHTFESLVEDAINGHQDAIKYCGFIKGKYLKDYTVCPATQGPDLAGFLQRVFWEPPVPEPQEYVRTLRTTG